MRSFLTIVIALVVIYFLWNAKVKLEDWHGKVTETLARVNGINRAANASDPSSDDVGSSDAKNAAVKGQDYRTLINLLEHKPYGLPLNASEQEVLVEVRKEVRDTGGLSADDNPVRLPKPSPTPEKAPATSSPAVATASIPRTISTPTPARYRYVLKNAQKVTTPYGSTTIVAGTEVIPVASSPGVVRVRAAGQEFMVTPADLTPVAY